jgi:hypothetical protein
MAAMPGHMAVGRASPVRQGYAQDCASRPSRFSPMWLWIIFYFLNNFKAAANFQILYRFDLKSKNFEIIFVG